MKEKTKTCSFIPENKLGYTCPHPLYKDHQYCIFHSPNVEEKKEDFQKELDKWLEYSENQEDIKEYDFRGFIFPEIDFSQKNFIKSVNFTESQFSGDVNFNKSTFLGNAIFSMNQFKGNTSFFESKFLEDTNFNESQFSDYAIFI